MSEVLGDDRKILTPFDKRECLSLKQAADIAGKSESTMRGWCEQHGLGRRVGGGTWSVSKVALAMFLDGDAKALRAYHSGDRTSELVMQYYQTGCSVPLRESLAADIGKRRKNEFAKKWRQCSAQP
jgi:hypothetical protein